MQNRPTTYDVLGTRISALTLTATLRLLQEHIETGRRGYICLCTVNEIVESTKNPAMRRALNGSLANTPDGMPLVWWGRRATRAPVSRVYGPDLLAAALVDSEIGDARHYFYGGDSPELTNKLVQNLRGSHPAARIVGWDTPPHRAAGAAEDPQRIGEINAKRPDIVWVGLGGAKQVLWMETLRPQLDAPLLIGVGAAFDFIAGVKTQAPLWMQRSGLEWSYRLMSEPTRLWRRYLVNNTIFILRTAAHVLRTIVSPLSTRWEN